MQISKNTICVWYDKDAEAAARFYAKTFPDSAVHRAPGDFPSGKKGDVLVVDFTVAGVSCIILKATTPYICEISSQIQGSVQWLPYGGGPNQNTLQSI